MTMQAGLCALRTPFCYSEEDKNINCPVCDKETFGIVAEKLPNAHHVNSCLVCRISGEVMNEDNQPMVLPNGRVYSQRVCSP
jgi:macrophage erythroblast attacher